MRRHLFCHALFKGDLVKPMEIYPFYPFNQLFCGVWALSVYSGIRRVFIGIRKYRPTSLWPQLVSRGIKRVVYIQYIREAAPLLFTMTPVSVSNHCVAHAVFFVRESPVVKKHFLHVSNMSVVAKRLL